MESHHPDVEFFVFFPVTYKYGCMGIEDQTCKDDAWTHLCCVTSHPLSLSLKPTWALTLWNTESGLWSTSPLLVTEISAAELLWVSSAMVLSCEEGGQHKARYSFATSLQASHTGTQQLGCHLVDTAAADRRLPWLRTAWGWRNQQKRLNADTKTLQNNDGSDGHEIFYISFSVFQEWRFMDNRAKWHISQPWDCTSPSIIQGGNLTHGSGNNNTNNVQFSAANVCTLGFSCYSVIFFYFLFLSTFKKKIHTLLLLY